MNADYVIVCYEKINEHEYTIIARDNNGVTFFLFRQHKYPEPKCHERVCHEEVKVSKCKSVTVVYTPRGSNSTHGYLFITTNTWYTKIFCVVVRLRIWCGQAVKSLSYRHHHREYLI